MPFALLVLAGAGQAAQAPAWIGQAGAGLAFLLVGAGLHTTQTAGLALATDLVPMESQAKVVGLMYVMLLLGTMVSALVFGALLEDFTHLRLVQVIQGSAVATVALNIVALWKQETRRPPRGAAAPEFASFRDSWSAFMKGDLAVRHLVAVGLGTMAFSMQDVLLEPYGGAVLGMSVSATTKLTATLAVGGLLGFGLASRVLSRGGNPFQMSEYGAMLGVPAFVGVIFSAPMLSPVVFAAGVLLIGFGAGLFSHGTLTATMNLAPAHQRGLALGAWGAVQASAAGIAVAIGGVLRDVVAWMASNGMLGRVRTGPETGYTFVYALEVLLLLVTVFALGPLIRRRDRAAQA
jgi:BCD family chlorophyll transporter-like MFS transporter